MKKLCLSAALLMLLAAAGFSACGDPTPDSDDASLDGVALSEATPAISPSEDCTCQVPNGEPSANTTTCTEDCETVPPEPCGYACHGDADPAAQLSPVQGDHGKWGSSMELAAKLAEMKARGVSCPREASSDITPWAAGDGNCPGDTQLPQGCILLAGTSERSARWLHCHRNRGNNCSEFCCWLGGPIGASCSLTSAMITQIANNCAAGDTATRLACAGRAVKTGLNGTGSVCRHHARCMNFVLEAMNLPYDLETSTTHAWSETASTTGSYISDAYNNIYYWCPSS